jgi:hypothetical protein
MKLTKRKGFNFFRSYFDVYNELESDKDKIAFIDALLTRQFIGVKPTDLKGMAKFAYISQVNSIDSQVKGFEDKTGIVLTPTVPPTYGGQPPPSLQVEVEGKEKVEEKDIHTKISKSFFLLNSEYEELNKTYPKKLLDDKIEAITNTKGAASKYVSFKKTLNNWCKKDFKKVSSNNSHLFIT